MQSNLMESILLHTLSCFIVLVGERIYTSMHVCVHVLVVFDCWRDYMYYIIYLNFVCIHAWAK